MLLKQTATEKTENSLSCVVIEGVDRFDVGRIFDCGQCFRFDPVTTTRHEVEFAGCAMGKYISVAQDGDTVFVYNVTLDEYEETWKRFLGLDRDYEKIDREILSLSSNPALASAIECSSGIRILHQDGWEAICSFMISQNNNIPRIKKLVAALCRACGDEIDISAMKGHIADLHKLSEGHFYSFPTPERVRKLDISGLAELKMGFRAKYIYDASDKLCRGELDISELDEKSTDECVDILCQVKGIGIKVASCALLFGFEKLDAFPVDVWIKRVIAKYFDENFDYRSLGRYAGVAQQYLFYYERYLQSREE